MKKIVLLTALLLAVGIPYNLGWSYTVSKVKHMLKHGTFEKQNNTLLIPKPKDLDAKIQLALLLDVSNSMDGLIDQAKSQLWMMVDEIGRANKFGKKVGLEIALYTYGHDGYPVLNGYVRQENALTMDLDRVSESLFSVITNGGQEYCGFVIDKTLKELEWSIYQEDMRIIVIAGNESFHQGDIQAADVIRLAKQKEIIINTIYCGDINQGKSLGWSMAANETGGRFMNIDQNEAIVHIATPYDDDILKLNQTLNGTYLFYGSNKKEEKNLIILQDANARKSGASAIRSRISSKTWSMKNKKQDLAAVPSESLEELVVEMDEEYLPEEIRNLSEKDRIQYIEDKKAEREKIQQELSTLNAKAREYEASERAKMNKTSTLDNTLIIALKEQLKKNAFSF